MRIDLTRATLVLAGQWNPAIFQPPWMAKHLFGLPEGATVPVVQVQSIDNPQDNSWFFGEVGIQALSRRISIFVNTLDEDTQRKAESAMLAIYETNPFAPVTALGVNFIIAEDDPDPELTDRLKIADGVDRRFRVSETSVVSSIVLDGAAADDRFNLRRDLSAQGITFNFNYHHTPLSLERAREIIPGCIDSRFRQVQEILREFYGAGDFSFLRHEFPPDLPNIQVKA